MKEPHDDPLVSVVIPTYNRASAVAEAVGSVLAQTFENFELIVVDDGAEDATGARRAAMGSEAKDPGGFSRASHPRRLRLSIAHIGMPGAVRNRGAAIARGTYLAFLDSDDLWSPAKLEKQAGLMSALAREPNAEDRMRISHTRELWLRDGSVVSQAGQKHRREGDIFRDSLKKCVIGPSTVVLERALFAEYGGFREDLEIAEDYELWVRIASKERIAYLDEELTIKRGGRPDQLSGKYGQIEIFRLRALRDLLDSGFFEGNDDRKREATEEFARKCRIYAAGCRKRGKIAEAVEYEAAADRRGM